MHTCMDSAANTAARLGTLAGRASISLGICSSKPPPRVLLSRDTLKPRASLQRLAECAHSVEERAPQTADHVRLRSISISITHQPPSSSPPPWPTTRKPLPIPCSPPWLRTMSTSHFPIAGNTRAPSSAAARFHGSPAPRRRSPWSRWSASCALVSSRIASRDSKLSC